MASGEAFVAGVQQMQAQMPIVTNKVAELEVKLEGHQNQISAIIRDGEAMQNETLALGGPDGRLRTGDCRHGRARGCHLD